MKSRVHLIPLWLSLMGVLALGSWLLSLYGEGEVQSLLSAEGLRHEARSAVRQYMACPELALYLVLAPGLGLAWGSGWPSALRRLFVRRSPSMDGSVPALTRRERRSLNWAHAMLLLSLVLMLLTVVGPWTTLRGVSGTLWPSPFLQGLPLFVSLALALTGWIYGYTTGRFRKYADIRRSLERPLRRGAAYPIHLFLVVRLFGQFSYTRLPDVWGLPAAALPIAFHVVALTLLIYIMYRSRVEEPQVR
jgi:aminobenzoyl-glutamate transport protein